MPTVGGVDTIVVFARAPELGRVKSRLAAEIGEVAALAAYDALARGCWRNTLEARDDTGCRAVIAFTPDDAGPAVHAWLADADSCIAQGTGDLGDRMLGAITAVLAAGARKVVVTGTDCPALSAAVLRDAFAALDASDVVLGPATDGGYYLIGMSAAHGAVFTGVPWGSDRTLAVTLAHSAAAGLRVALLGPLSDVDTAEDWRAWTHSLNGPG